VYIRGDAVYNETMTTAQALKIAIKNGTVDANTKTIRFPNTTEGRAAAQAECDRRNRHFERTGRMF
jgi:hypothetical protein